MGRGVANGLPRIDLPLFEFGVDLGLSKVSVEHVRVLPTAVWPLVGDAMALSHLAEMFLKGTTGNHGSGILEALLLQLGGHVEKVDEDISMDEFGDGLQAARLDVVHQSLCHIGDV